MNIASFSIKRPILISSIVILSVLTGWISLTRLGVDLFPDVNIPVIVVTTVYPGAGPEEIENMISRPLEEELSSISGLNEIRSISQEGFSTVVAEFGLDVDIKWAEQEIRTRVARARRNLPSGIEEPLIVRFDPADQPVTRLSLTADLPPNELYDLAHENIKPLFEQVRNVGSVKIVGGARREIQIELDRNRMNLMNIPAVAIARAVQSYGANIPIGKYDKKGKEISYRTVGRFETLSQIENVAVIFAGDFDNALTLQNLGTVRDGSEDTKTIAELYAPIAGDRPGEELKRESRPALFIDIYKQSGSNTVEVADATLKRMARINDNIAEIKGNPHLAIVRDGSRMIRINIEDVTEAIILGIILTIIVVYFFLGNPRSTIITGLAIPNSMLGAFVIMYAMGFTINLMTLLALSLSVGLLVDDAIVVRENIFRKLEDGMNPVLAAVRGTNEVALAVLATTATVIAVFFPVGFLSGIVGQFFKQFGLTVVFAMLVSLFDALTVAPLLSAYFAGNMNHRPNILIRGFDKFQSWLEDIYGIIMRFALDKPWAVIILSTIVFLASIGSLAFVKNTFMSPNDFGEFMVSIQMPPGTSLRGTYDITKKIQKKMISGIPEIDRLASVVGTEEGDPTQSTIGVMLVDSKLRSRSTAEVKDRIRGLLENYEFARPSVNDYSMVGGGVQYPFVLLIKGENLEELAAYSERVIEHLKTIPDLIDIDTDFRTGKPEFQVKLDPVRMQTVGIAAATAGYELRLHVAGDTVGKFYDNGLEYDIRMRLKPEQRDLKSAFLHTKVPNMGSPPRMIPLSVFSRGEETLGPQRIDRQDRSRVVVIHANLAPGGAIGNATDLARKIIDTKISPPPGIETAFVGQSEDLRELMQNIIIAFGLALVFIYLVLASLYESFITPITILFAIPPAISGAFFALALTGEMLNIFSMIGIILLMGLVTKNSILLVDYALEGIRAGLSRKDAIYNAGRIRLRPILMTSFAMIAGTIPIALGLNEASKARTAMGIAIIGGLIGSTLITLIVVPAIFGYIDRFRDWIESFFRPDYEVNIDDGHENEMARDLKDAIQKKHLHQ